MQGPGLIMVEDTGDKEAWAGVARHWYSVASERAPMTGRLIHHLAILARPTTLQQIFYYVRLLLLPVATPFTSAQESPMTLFDPVLNATSRRGIKGKVIGRDVWAFGDTGAGQNIISAQHAEELGLHVHKNPRRLRMGNSNTAFSPGIVNYPWAFSENPNEVTNITAHVLDGLEYDLILGNPFLQATQTMTKHISRFVKGVFRAQPKWTLNLLGETSHRLEGLLRGSVPVQGLPDIGSSRNMMNEDWAKAHQFPIKSGRENCGVVHFPDGTTVPTTGQVYTTITLPGGDAIPIVFEVLPNCYVPVVLGEDFVFDNDIYSNYADSIHGLEWVDCSADLLLMDYQKPWYATVAEKAKLLLQPKRRKQMTTSMYSDHLSSMSEGIVTDMKLVGKTQSAKTPNDVIEVERQHKWDLRYQYGSAASPIEWDAEHSRRENHELRQYPQWRLRPNHTLIKYRPMATIVLSEADDEYPHEYPMFGANEAELWRAEHPSNHNSNVN